MQSLMTGKGVRGGAISLNRNRILETNYIILYSEYHYILPERKTMWLVAITYSIISIRYYCSLTLTTRNRNVMVQISVFKFGFIMKDIV